MLRKSAILLFSTLIFGASCAQVTDILGGGDQGSLVVKALSPICAEQIVKNEDIKKVLDTARLLIEEPEKKVCDCAIEKAEKKVTDELAQIPELLTDTDKQIDFIMGLAGECATEIATSEIEKAAKDPLGAIGGILGGDKKE